MTNVTIRGALAPVLLVAGMVPIGVVAQSAVDEALLKQGAQLYTDNCVACHQAGGAGVPPDFPALAGNPHLEDLGLIVGNVHNGKGAMPALPDLTAEEVAALATYVRNNWGNSFGGTTEAEVASLIGGLAPASSSQTASIWSGVYTDAQADRGKQVLSGSCAKCHGTRLNGAGDPDQQPSPAIARAGFLKKWEGKTVEALFTYIHTTMPKDNPGQLTDQQTADVLAEMFRVSNVPAGSAELPADAAALGGLSIEASGD